MPELALARAQTADETKRMMRRLSKENTKQYGRHLGKLSHGLAAAHPVQRCRAYAPREGEVVCSVGLRRVRILSLWGCW